jgi:hypothetical protein
MLTEKHKLPVSGISGLCTLVRNNMYITTPYSAELTGCSLSSVHTKHCILNGVHMRLGLEQSLRSSF